MEDGIKNSEDKKIDYVLQVDWFLQNIINIVNGNDFEFGITINISGFLVSGFLVSGHKYFEGFAEDFTSAFCGVDDREIVKESFLECGKIYTKDELEKQKQPPSYIHLKDAKFLIQMETQYLETVEYGGVIVFRKLADLFLVHYQFQKMIDTFISTSGFKMMIHKPVCPTPPVQRDRFTPGGKENSLNRNNNKQKKTLSLRSEQPAFGWILRRVAFPVKSDPS